MVVGVVRGGDLIHLKVAANLDFKLVMIRCLAFYISGISNEVHAAFHHAENHKSFEREQEFERSQADWHDMAWTWHDITFASTCYTCIIIVMAWHVCGHDMARTWYDMTPFV